ncbi:hypothetical protein ROLI_041280 [Roseobacter fucihabitans]|uniref:Inner membrane protein YgaP-like transmembrane domain-containing protein n=1 Tax=Roseobacter fucihabitans TaxID=1537242 RepID=A0ABZ2C119_9RHOB|nr:DUF2892 domain-containing protein [Roseobacter litoralis]MBC6967777.1 hypothetical protein [Roseobacter litoralis]
MKLATNLGSLDRLLRILIGGMLMLLAAWGAIGIWGWIGAILVVTAFLKFCPIYRILGMKTCQDC